MLPDMGGPVMGGKGSGPRPADRRVSKDHTPATVLPFHPSSQPALPADVEWHEATVAWWAMWGRAPQSAFFVESDWSFLLDTAVMHHAFWAHHNMNLAGELRLRVAKFGATPEDRARLRMVFADADEADARRFTRVVEADTVMRDRYGSARAVVAG